MHYIEEFKSYLTQKALSKQTIKNYAKDVMHFVIWIEDRNKIVFYPKTIDQEHINHYVESLTVSLVSKQRYRSSLRKFFRFLHEERFINKNPFEKERRNGVDTWKLSDFSHYLSICNASELTIKFYLMDIKHFLNWFETEKGDTQRMLLLLDKYLQALLQQQKYSQATLKRKQAAIRKYYAWIQR